MTMGTSNAPGDWGQALQAAARHSRWVRRLRIAIPVSMVVSLALCSLVIWLNALSSISLNGLPRLNGTLAVSGSDVTMEKPRLAGYTNDSRPYELTARTATQDFTKPNRIDLRDIHATMAMADGTVVEMSAANGIYNTQDERVTLGERIVLTTSSGYEAHLTEAAIDMRQGHIISDKPVDVTMLNGVLNANRLEVVNSGELVRFSNGVAVALQPPALPRSDTPSGVLQKHEEPVNIEANALDVRDKERKAIFLGGVRVIHTDSTLRSEALMVDYEESAAPDAALQPSRQQIRKIEAQGGVVITQKDRTATADSGTFEARTDIVELTRNVVITKGPNMLRGDRLTVDMSSGVSRLESDKPGGGRVEAVIEQVVSASPPPPATGVSNALQGFARNRGRPMAIVTDSLEVRDRDKIATFLGSVRATQGDATIRSRKLVAYYEPDTSPGVIASAPPADDQLQIRKVEAEGGVMVTQKEQTATGNRGIFETKTHTMKLLQDVVVTTGPHILRGDLLVVDTKSGQSRLVSARSRKGRVQGLFGRDAMPNGGLGAAPVDRKAKAGERAMPRKPESN